MRYIEEVLAKRDMSGIFSQEEIDLYDELIMPVDTNINIDSVILSQENKDKLSSFLVEQDNRDKLLRHGLQPMNRLLFYGASGTGKTYLSKALSNYMGYTMLYIDIAKSLSENTIAQNISAIFKLGNRLKRSIIFMDECDSVVMNRDSVSQDSGVVRRATNSLFQQLDQMDPGNIFISATNLLHRIDIAFERRFNMKLEFKRPSNIDEAIIKFLYEDFLLEDDVNPEIKKIISTRALESPKLSYYEIQGIVERAMKRAVIKDELTVRTSDIYKDIAVAERIRINYRPELDKKK